MTRSSRLIINNVVVIKDKYLIVSMHAFLSEVKNFKQNQLAERYSNINFLAIAFMLCRLFTQNSYFLVIHKTSITVNQNGVTLAAGSGLTALIRLTYRELATNTMLVNRPFLFFIEDSTTKMMIFLGQVTDPR